MNRLLLTILFGLLSVASILGRETIKGVVVDSKGDPIPGVKIEIPGSSEFAFTDLDGAFQILLRDPVKNLNFSYPGYGTATHRVHPEMRVVLGKGWSGHTKGFRALLDLEGGMGIKGKATVKSGNLEVTDIHTLVLPGMTYTVGYQFNKNLYLGAGLGAYLDLTQYGENEHYSSSYYSWSNTELTGVYIPFYLAARWDFGLTKKTAPYIGLRAGFIQFITEDDRELGYMSDYNGESYTRLEVFENRCGSFFLMPSVGYRMSIYKKFGMNLGLSYMAGMKRKLKAITSADYETSSSVDIIHRNSDAIIFNIGFDF